jgi:hypothetical protein
METAVIVAQDAASAGACKVPRCTAAFLLEPVSCLVRVAMLSFQPIGTKIAIDKSMNRVQIMPPGVSQPLMRWYNGQSRNDLFFLLQPLVVAKVRLDAESHAIREILRFAVQGLKRLRATYQMETNTTSHALKLFASYLSDDADPADADVDLDDPFVKEIYNSYDTLWTTRQVDAVSYLLLEADACRVATEGAYCNLYLSAVDCVLRVKESASLETLSTFTRNLNFANK